MFSFLLGYKFWLGVIVLILTATVLGSKYDKITIESPETLKSSLSIMNTNFENLLEVFKDGIHFVVANDKMDLQFVPPSINHYEEQTRQNLTPYQMKIYKELNNLGIETIKNYMPREGIESIYKTLSKWNKIYWSIPEDFKLAFKKTKAVFNKFNNDVLAGGSFNSELSEHVNKEINSLKRKCLKPLVKYLLSIINVLECCGYHNYEKEKQEYCKFEITFNEP